MSKYKQFKTSPTYSNSNIISLEGIAIGDKVAVYISGWSSSGHYEFIECTRLTAKQAEFGSKKYWIKDASEVGRSTNHYSRGGWIQNITPELEIKIAHETKVRKAKRLLNDTVDTKNMPEDLLFILADAIEKYYQPKPAAENA